MKADQRRSQRRGGFRATVAAILIISAIGAAVVGVSPPADAAPGNPCERGDFRRIYRTDFGGRHTLENWTIYDRTPGHAGNGRRSASAVKTKHGKLVITARHEDGQTVSGGLSHKGLSQRYGCYRFRVRTDHDYSNVTSGVVMTWPTERRWSNGREVTKKAHGENDIYETTHRYAKRRPFMTFIHKPGDYTDRSKDQHWYRHDAQADRYQIMTMVWTPNEMIIVREGLDNAGRHSTTEHRVPAANIPHVRHHPAIQLDARNNNPLGAPVRLELDWFEVYAYSP